MAQSRWAYSRLAVTVLVAGLAVLLGATTPAIATSQSVDIYPGQNLASIVNTDSATTATTFYLHGQNGDSYTYNVGASLRLSDGDELIGDTGTFIERGPAFDPQPTVSIAGNTGVSNVIRAEGTVHLEWVEIVGGTGQYSGGSPQAGTGSGLAMGKASDASSVYAVRITGSDGTGISNARGTFDRIELDDTTRDPNFLGFTGAGLKAITEIQVKNSYVHDNQGNGLWCDEYCNDSALQPNGFWIHDNLLVNNGRAGVRYEKVGDVATAGEALIESNEVHGNARGSRVGQGGIEIRDAQDALVRNNVFGATTVADVAYLNNANLLAVRASDSGKADRPDLRNVTIADNVMNGETIQGCELPDEIVACPQDEAPETVIDSGPNGAVNSASAGFGFSSSETGSTFECSLDAASFVPCAPPKEYSSLPDGEHTFEVRAVDTGGSVDPTPARQTWTVDTAAPGTPSISSPDDNSLTNTGSVTLSGTAESGSTIEVFDGTTSLGTTQANTSGAWAMTISGVPDGQHAYSATATDAATNTSPPSSSRTVIADTAAPSVSSINRADSVTDPTNASSVGWNVTFSEGVTGVDAADFQLVNPGGGLVGTSVTGVSPVANGTAYRITANTGNGAGTLRLDLADDGSISDLATNQLGGPGTGNGNFTMGQAYAIDRTVPTVTIDSTSPSTVGATGSSIITWHADERGPYSVRAGGADCSTGTLLASGGYTTGANVQTNVGAAALSEGSNTIRVCVRDAAGNAGSKTTTITRISDTTPPTVASTFPRADATGVIATANVTANFSEDMNASTINGTTFQLFKKGSTSKLAAAVSYSASTDKATLDPTSSLQKGATYRAVVSTGARDLAGNSLDQTPSAGLQEMAWSFTVKK